MPRAPQDPLSPSTAPTRRSVCPVACCLDIFGDRWTLLIIRDLILGRTRFRDFAASPEGMPTNILADRLRRLVRHGVVLQVPGESTKHRAYRLTEKGQALLPLIREMRDWSLAWEPGTQAALEQALPGLPT